MFFLTYIKGSHVNEWVVAVNRWLTRQLQGGIANTDERLWNEVAASFLRHFADNLAKEKAQSLLCEGIKMKGKDIDSYIAEFKERQNTGSTYLKPSTPSLKDYLWGYTKRYSNSIDLTHMISGSKQPSTDSRYTCR